MKSKVAASSSKIIALLAGLATLLLAGRAGAQIAYVNAPSAIEYNAADTLNTASFTVSSGASVLVVCLNSRTQGDSPGSDPGLPATITWNGHTLTRAVAQGSTASTWDDNAIYYLMNPPAGTGSISGTLASTITQNWWLAYTLSGVNTSATILTGAVGNGAATTVNNTVASVAAGDWAAVSGSCSQGTATIPTLAVSPSGGTLLTTAGDSTGNANQIMGAVSNCPPGSVQFTLNSNQSATGKMVLIEAIFATAPPVGAPNWDSVTTGNPAEVNLTWSAVTNAANYLLSRGKVNGGPYTDFTNVISGTNYQDRQVLSGTEYYYVVSAANASGTNTSVQTNATPVGTLFAPVLGGGGAGVGNVGLAWTAPTGATNYLVLAGTTSGGEVQIAMTTANKYTVTGLPPGSTNYFTVEAVGASGTSAPSDEISVIAPGSAWYLFDNFSLDTVGAALNGQTGSAGLGLGWTNLGGGTPIVVANSATFGGANYAQYSAGSVANIGDYESGLGIASNSMAATVFLEFSLPGITGTFGNTNGTAAVAMNFDIDNSSPPGALTGGSATGPSAQFNYDNTTGFGFFRVNSAGTFYFVTLSPANTPYQAIPGDVYYFWFVIDAAQNTYQVYLANGSESGTNVDAGGLGAAPTLMWGTTATNGLGSVITYGFRNVSVGGAGGQPVNYIGTGPGSALGTVAQNEYANIYVDRLSQDLTNPVTGAAPAGTPQILAQPQPLELYAGATAMFSIVGSAGVTFQWESNGVPIANAGQFSGATTATLVISNVVATEAANYSCVVANPATASFASSTPAALTIVTPNGAYESTNAAAGPAHFYAFNDTGNPASGTEVAFDYTGGDNGLYGTNTQNGSTPITGPLPSEGFPGFSAANYAAQFTANDEPSQVTIDNPWNFNTNTVTITAWINPSAAQADATAIVFNRGNGNDVEGLNFSTSGDSALSYTWNNDAGTYGWDSGLQPPPNQWSFVALVVTPTNATISMMNTNGLLSSTHVYPHAAAAFAGTTLIGDDNFSATGARTFAGAIDEVSVFSQALTQSQLYDLYTNAAGVVDEAPTNSVDLLTAEPIYPAQSAQFSSIDGGSALLSYTWQINGTNLVDGTSVFGMIYGSATPFLMISNLTAGDAGQNYNVTLVTANAYGAYTSSVPAVLDVSAINPDQTIDTTGFEPEGDDWNTGSYWSDGNPASVSVYSEPGSTYYIVPGTVERTPVSTNAVFPGSVMVVQGNGVLLDGNAGSFGTETTTGELRAKESGTTSASNYGLVYTQGGTITFPDLQLDGGQIDNGSSSAVILAGEIDVLTNSSIYADSAAASETRSYQINALLTGTGTLTYSFLGNAAAYVDNAIVISNPGNTFSGQWNILQGALVGNAPNSLGTNSIFIATNAALETTYNLVTTNGVLTLNGQMYLYTTDTVRGLFVNNNNVTPGTYTWAQLNAAYPANFPATWPVQLGSVTGTNTGSGSITILAGPPVFSQQPTPATLSLYPTQTAQFTAFAANATSYQWWFTNLSNIGSQVVNGGGISGATSNVLTIASVADGNAGTYVLIATDVNGSSTSATAVLTVLPTSPPEAITMPGYEPSGNDWNTGSYWSDGNPASLSALEYPGSTYEVLPGALLRTPAGAVSYTNFPGVSLQIDGIGVFTNNPVAGSPQGEMRLKEGVSSQTIYFPLLIMNGGQIDNGSAGVPVLTGTIEILSNTPIYVDNAGGEDRAIQLNAGLTGDGSIEYHDYDASMTGGLDVDCATNTFTGTWDVVQGPLLGAQTNALGTNSIMVGSKSALETLYDIYSPGATLSLNGIVYLHENDTFYEAAINGAGLPAGVYSCAYLTNAFPTNFPPSWNAIYGSTNNLASGSITVLNTLVLPPAINSQPPDQSEEFADAAMTYSLATSGNQGTFQWFLNGSAIGGATNSIFKFSSLGGTNVYYCVVSNSAGIATSIMQTNVAVDPPVVVTFDDTANWTLQGTAITPSLSSDVLVLTDNGTSEAASAFYDIAQYCEGFNANFIYTPGGSLGADGVTFCIQNSAAGPTALGGNGGNLGYFGINRSVAFQLNIYTLATGGVGMGFGTNGSIANPYLGVAPVNLASGDPITVNLYYMLGQMQVTLTDTVSSVTFTTNMTLPDFGSLLGDSIGYVGFTGADGGSVSSQQISNFAFTPAAPPVLSLASFGATCTLSWSGGVLTNMVVQQSSAITGPWADAGATPALVGNSYQVQVAPTNSATYFRLNQE